MATAKVSLIFCIKSGFNWIHQNTDI